MQTKVIELNADKPDTEVIKAAAKLLDTGGLVAFPTETVYGIGCRAEAKALEKLNQAKQRTGQKRYTIHIGQKNDVKKYVPQLSLRVEKLIRKAWPGPLTIVFELTEQQIAQQRSSLNIDFFDAIYKDNSIGIRCPDNRIASMLLQHCHSPIVAPSANISGHITATDADEARAQLDGRVDLILDGGPSRYRKSSTVVKLGKKGCQILREGVFSKPDIARMSQVNILFVCTGNTCRSPIAEGLSQKYLAEKLQCDIDCLGQIGYKISSAGVMAVAGTQVSREAVAACAEVGVDITGCTSRSISAALVAESDYIFVMCENHRRLITANWPEAAQKCQLLAENAGIPDPIGQGLDVFRRTRQLIDDALSKRVSELIL